MNGNNKRSKYRIRIYDFSDKKINFECKSKYESYIAKRSVRISRDLCEQLITSDPSGLENTSSGLLRDIYREMRLNLLRPVVIVDYVREAYTHPAENIRITFDKQLRFRHGQNRYVQPAAAYLSAIPANQIILEVKFDKVLPAYISALLSSAAGWASRSAISKYCLCRGYEGKEY